MKKLAARRRLMAELRDLKEMRAICNTNDKEKVIEKLKVLVPTFHHDTAYLELMRQKELQYQKEYSAEHKSDELKEAEEIVANVVEKETEDIVSFADYEETEDIFGVKEVSENVESGKNDVKEEGTEKPAGKTVFKESSGKKERKSGAKKKTAAK